MLGQAPYVHRRLPPYPGLGQTDAFGRAVGVLLDPVYVEIERRAVVSIKEQVGPYVLGGFVGLILWNIFITRWFAKATRKTIPSPI